MRLNAARAAIPARRSRRNLASGSEALQPAYGAGDADPETLGRRVARHAPYYNSVHNTFAKILGKRHSRRLLRAASIMNHKHTRFGNPLRFKSLGDCSNEGKEQTLKRVVYREPKKCLHTVGR